jgi:uncharacterized membrane protein
MGTSATSGTAPAAASRWHRPLLLAAILVAFAVRLYSLGAESLWYDETVSVYLSRLPLPAMVAHTAGDIHPPGYYALLHAWQALTAPSLAHGLEFLYAFPSLVFGLLALPLLYALGRRLFGPRTGLAALWLGAFAPFLVWYSQEVRMYTLGAFLGLLCLWALLKFCAPTPPLPGRLRYAWLAVYIPAAAAGLCTLYYFLFLLIALNLIALLLIWLSPGARSTRRGCETVVWLGAQVAVLLLWLPWLPIFWRQATDPPVPPWRAPWDSLSAFAGSLAETLAALLVGQTPPAGITSAQGGPPAAGAAWPWAIVTVLLLVGMLVLGVTRAGRRTTDWARTRLWLAVATVLLYVFVPIAILYAATLLGTPIYHVRYLALYAPLFLLAPAWLVANATNLRTWLGAALWAALLATFALALFAYWTNPIYRADDHRTAVADLAQRWRPGDAILANAGWIYPILTTYWPGGVIGSGADSAAGDPGGGRPVTGTSQPPPLQPLLRLSDYTQIAATQPLTTPLVVLSGSVDGPPSLGWGDPNSDFFAVSEGDTTTALTALAQHARRIWHYRLYDTVSDPNGAIRNWLATNTMTGTETLIPGRDYGQVQLFTTPLGAPSPAGSMLTTTLATFGGAVDLVAAAVPTTITAGSYLYADLLWRALPPLATLAADLSTSLRLYDAGGQQVAQADGPLHASPTGAWDPALLYPQTTALPIPAGLTPGPYSLQIIVYRQDNAAALPEDKTGEQAWELGEVEVQPLY